MGHGTRRLLKARYAAPAALVGCVGIVGLLGFSPGSAQADPVPSTTLPTLVSTSATATPTPTATPTGQPAPPSVSGELNSAAPPDQSGISYAQLPASFIAPGQALF
ncbi:MAG: hypothetical protein ACRDU0_12460, partial [Mycobacterium sp.]